MENKNTNTQQEQQVKNSSMININPNISIITLNISGLNAPNKDRDCQSGTKNNNQKYLVYKKLL